MPNWKKIIVSGSDASLSSAYIEGNLTASAAYLTSASIGHLETIYETASVIYSSGSTKFGDTLDDTHEITGSLLVTGSITGNLTGTASIADIATTASQADSATTASIADELSQLATASFAITASHALNVPDTASHALTAVTASHTAGTASIANFATTASFAITASHLIGNTGNSGSFSGSFEGDGSALTGITVASTTLVEDTFISATSVTSSHNFETKNVNVVVYDDNDEMILPENVKIFDTSTVGVGFGGATVSGRLVITKGGHIVSGSIPISEITLVTASFNASSYTASHEFGTRNVNVTVYDNDYNQILPENIRILDTGSVGLDFGGATVEGNVVITKGGHIVTGSQVIEYNVVTASTFEDTFTAVTSHTASHNFGTKNVFVQIYDSSDNVIVPSNIKTIDVNEVGIDFASTRTGRVIVGKSGHIVSGTLENVTSASLAETASFYGGSVISASFAESSSITSQAQNTNTSSGSLSFWQGSQAEYDLISASADENTVYFVV